jgi:hypothetical protein
VAGADSPPTWTEVALRGRGPRQVRQENSLGEKDATSGAAIEKVVNTLDTGHDKGCVNKVTPERGQIVWSEQLEDPNDEPAVHQ